MRKKVAFSEEERKWKRSKKLNGEEEKEKLIKWMKKERLEEKLKGGEAIKKTGERKKMLEENEN